MLRFRLDARSVAFTQKTPEVRLISAQDDRPLGPDLMSARDTVVFLGPTWPTEEARRIFDADYRPPARRGDVYACLGSPAKRLVLIDGLFHGTPSVWQRELLSALDEGVEVFGASSMGALRAVELEPYGMVGHGTIFGWYRDGVVDGDDEVALLHGDAGSGYRHLSEPLVNLRATIACLEADGTLSTHEATTLVGEAKATFYPQRSRRQLAHGEAAAAWSPERRAQVEGRLRDLYVDQKRADAESLLRWCASNETRPGARRLPSRDTHADERARMRSVTPGITGETLHHLAETHGVAARLWPELAERWYAVQWARERGIHCPGEVSAGVRDELESHLASRVPEARDAWLCDQGVTRGEYIAWTEELGLVRWLSHHPDVVSRGPDAASRIASVAREWLATWGLASPDLPEPDTLGFTWPRHATLLVELLLTGEGRRLLEASR
jgi:hypothetical protein